MERRGGRRDARRAHHDHQRRHTHHMDSGGQCSLTRRARSSARSGVPSACATAQRGSNEASLPRLLPPPSPPTRGGGARRMPPAPPRTHTRRACTHAPPAPHPPHAKRARGRTPAAIRGTRGCGGVMRAGGAAGEPLRPRTGPTDRCVGRRRRHPRAPPPARHLCPRACTPPAPVLLPRPATAAASAATSLPTAVWGGCDTNLAGHHSPPGRACAWRRSQAAAAAVCPPFSPHRARTSRPPAGALSPHSPTSLARCGGGRVWPPGVTGWRTLRGVVRPRPLRGDSRRPRACRWGVLAPGRPPPHRRSPPCGPVRTAPLPPSFLFPL